MDVPDVEVMIAVNNHLGINEEYINAQCNRMLNATIKKYTHPAFRRLKNDMQLRQAVQVTVGNSVQEIWHG